MNINWETIDACVQEKSLLTHEYYVAWSHGELTLDDLRFYAKQYYVLETTFPRLLSRVHASCADPAIRQAILGNLNDEELGEENHRELWLRFAEGLGLTRDEVINAECHPMTQQCIDELMQLAADPNPAVGLSALYAYESQLPEISKSKIEGLKRFYDIDNARAVQFFEVHKTADIWHSEQEKTAINSMNVSMDTVRSAVEKACAALWTFMDGVNGQRVAVAA